MGENFKSLPTFFFSLGVKKQKKNMSFTFLPASLLCKFISGCAFLGFFLLFLLSRASTKAREKVMPKSTLSEQPDHCESSEWENGFLMTGL